MSGGEIFLIMLFVLIFFGADKIPEIARGLGKGLREFKKAADEIKTEISHGTVEVRNEVADIRAEVNSGAAEVKQSLTETTSGNTAADQPQDNSYSVYSELQNDGNASTNGQPEVTDTIKNRKPDNGNTDLGANI